uniref:Uncharacterized protein n=1 Tax=Schistocephalus solidus TaxID=70667 RepID=A0A0V0J7H7_SCHSO
MSQGAALFDRPVPTQQPRHLLQFKAGKMTMKSDHWVHPDPRKGCAYLYQSSDSKVHFCWFDRRTGLVEDNYVLVPKQTEFKPVSQCKSGRVYVLKNKDQRLFIWMQEPDAKNDSEICDSVNRFIDSPPPATRMSDLLGSIRGLSGLSQNDLLALLSMGVGLGSGLSSDTDTSSAQALAASTGMHLNMSRVESPAVHSAAPTIPLIRPNASSTAGTTDTSHLSGSSPARFRLQDLHSILSAVQPGPSVAAKIDLSEGINADSVRDLLPKKDVEDRLAAHLPPRDPEDKVLTTSENIITNVQSPQFQSALKSFSEAFSSGELAPVMSQFKLCDGAVDAAKTGDLEALATALQDASTSETNVESSAPADASKADPVEKDDNQSEPDQGGSEKMDTS